MLVTFTLLFNDQLRARSVAHHERFARLKVRNSPSTYRDEFERASSWLLARQIRVTRARARVPLRQDVGGAQRAALNWRRDARAQDARRAGK